MTRIEREQAGFDAECMRLHARGRMTEKEQRYQAEVALRKGLDDSVVWMKLVETSPAVSAFCAVVTPEQRDRLEAVIAAS